MHVKTTPRLILITLLWLLTSCVRSQSDNGQSITFVSTAARPGLPTIAVFAPPDQKLVGVVAQLRNELETDFNVVVTPIAGKNAVPNLARTLSRIDAQAVVLLNNSTARAYRHWALQQVAPPVAVILMASFAEDLQDTIPRSVGIAYEVPAVTSFVGLRGLGTSVKRVGVIYRESFSGYIQAQARLAAVEKVAFVVEPLSNEPEVRDLKGALVRLKRAGVDALWLPNDNGLLTPRLLAKAWLPYLERLNLPVIVGVPSLVRADYALGVFGAIPDPDAMALQAADLLFELYDAEWELQGTSVRLPLSVRTYVAKGLAEKFGFNKEALANVDVVVDDKRDVHAADENRPAVGGAL